jgi:hypothetical protein
MSLRDFTTSRREAMIKISSNRRCMASNETLLHLSLGRHASISTKKQVFPAPVVTYGISNGKESKLVLETSLISTYHINTMELSKKASTPLTELLVLPPKVHSSNFRNTNFLLVSYLSSTLRPYFS